MPSLPPGFRVLAAVVSDFHLWTPVEESCERFLWQQGLRRGVADKVWNWMVRVKENRQLAHRLLAELRQYTDALISLGDHYNHVVNPWGLGEQRTRISALSAQERIQGHGWKQEVHVPSDHDIGVPHPLTSSIRLAELGDWYEEFEKTPRYKQLLLDTCSFHVDLRCLLETPSIRSNDALPFSLEAYRQIFGSLWGRRSIGEVDLIWACDVLIDQLHTQTVAEEEVAQLAREQAAYLTRVFAQTERAVFCVHNPYVLPTLLHQVWAGRVPPSLASTIVGHVHMPWLGRWLIPSKIRKEFRVKVCPSLTGNRLAAGGGLLLGIQPSGRIETVRYKL